MAVRNESVRLSFIDDSTAGVLKAAAAYAVLDKAIDGVDGSMVGSAKSTDRATKATKEFTFEQAFAAERAKRLQAALSTQAASALDAEDRLNASTSSTKALAFQQALAAERASRLNKELRQQAKAAVDAESGVDRDSDSISRLSVAAVRGANDINQYSGRLSLLAKVAGAVGPSLIPIGALAIPAVAGLANQFGFAAIAAGTAVLAFQGVGDTLKAVNAAALEPSVKNLQAARDAMASLSPAGRDLVDQIQQMKPLFEQLRNTAAEGLFPGVIRGFESLEKLAPRVNSLIAEVSETLGRIFARGARSLASDRWADFFSMLESEARPTLKDLASTIGDFAHGMSELWEAFAPLNRSFGGWLADVANGFDKWAQGLSQTEGFRDFMDYLDQNGPLVADAMGSIANALVQIVQAAAPLGGPVLQAIAGIADAIATIADSPLGTPIFTAVTAMSALSLASTAATASVTRLNASMAALGVTSKATLAAGGASAAAGSGGVVPLLAVFLGVENSIGNIQDALSGDMGGEEFLSRTLIPGINTLEFFGIEIDETAGKLKDFLTGHEDVPFVKNMVDATLAADNFGAAVGDIGEQIAGDPFQALRNGARLSAAEIRGLTTAMLENRNAAIGAFDAVTNYRLALKAARAQADKNNAGINGMSKAALSNRQALSALAAAWNSQSAAVRNSSEKFREARSAFIQTAQAMGVPREQAKALARELLAIPRSRVTDIKTNGAAEAAAAAARVRAEIAMIDRDVTVNIRSNVIGKFGFASGGYTGNLPKHAPAGVVHGREVVLPEDVVQRDKSMLLSRYGNLPGMSALRGYADGGFVDGTYSSTAPLGGGTFGELGGHFADGVFKAVTALEKVTAALRREERQLRQMEKAYDRQEKAIDKQRQKVEEAARAVEDMKQQMAAFAGDIAGRLTTDLFANGADFGAVSGILRGNAAAGSSWIESLTALQAMGLDGAALQAVLGGSAEQLAGVASWTPDQIAAFESLFNQSTRLTDAAGNLSAQALMGQQLTTLQTNWAEEKAMLTEQVQLGREMARALKAQEKYITWLEKRKDKIEQREEKNSKNLDKIAEGSKGRGEKAAANARARA